MKSYKTVQHDIKFTESKLNDILHSNSFETAVRALTERNPYFARHILKDKYPMSTVYELCNLAYHVDFLFEAEIKRAGWTDLQEYEQACYLDFQMHKVNFYSQFVLDDEPLPLKYNSVEKVLKEVNINLGVKQRQSLYKLIGEVSAEECNELIEKCREDIALFGWYNLKDEPLFRHQDDFNKEELVHLDKYISDHRRYILKYYTEGRTDIQFAKSSLEMIIKKLTALLQQYFPLTTESDIENYVMNSTLKDGSGRIDVVFNSSMILNYINSIIKKPKRRQYYYDELMCEINLIKKNIDGVCSK